jgi:Glyoxalase-like domain
MANRLTGITVDCADPARLAAFWSQLLDMEVTGEHGDGTGWATVGSRRDHRPRLTFQQVAEPKTAKVRIHLDVQADDIATARKQVESLGGAGPASGTITTKEPSWSCTIVRSTSSALSGTTGERPARP